MPNYSKSGKIMIPLTQELFIKGMSEGKFAREKHRGLAALLYYTGIRISEGLRAKKEQFSLQNQAIYFDVGKRLKHGKVTAPLKILQSKPYANLIWDAVKETKSKQRVFPFCRSTGYNVIARVWFYPHHLRLTRFTDLAKYGIAQLRSWSGLTLTALDYYMGAVDIDAMAEG